MYIKEKTIGEYIRNKRLSQKYTLRKFCFDNGLDPAYVSRLERDVFIPSKEGNLEKIAKALGLEKESNEWFEFFDLASISKGEIPKDLQNNPDFIKSLPLFFRTVRGKKPTKDDLKSLVEVLEEAGWQQK